MVLRPYQNEVIDNFNTEGSSLFRLDCRSGKSLILERVIDRYFNGMKVLIVSNRVEVLNELARYFHLHTKLQGNSKYDETINIVLATPQTLARRKNIDYNKFDCIAVDEIHEAQNMVAVKAIRDVFKNTFIGMTATPLTRANTYMGGFTHIQNATSVPQMIADGYLAPTRFYSAGDITAGNNIKVKAGEYLEADIEMAMSKSGLYEHIVRLNDEKYHWDTEHKTILYVSSVKSAEILLNSFNRPSVRILHSNLTRERYEANMHWFRTTKHCAIVSIRILTTGFNEKTVDSIVMLAPTRVKSLAMQTYFRGSTIDPDVPGKIAHVYDFGGSLKEHSPFFDDWFKAAVPSCMEKAKKIYDEDERFYAMLNCNAVPVVAICNGKLPSTYVDNEYVIDFVCTTPDKKPCEEVMSIHDKKYWSEEDASNKTIIYKHTLCKCGYGTKVVLKVRTAPLELVEVYSKYSTVNSVQAIYSKQYNRVLLIIDNIKLQSYKFAICNSQEEILAICKKALNGSKYMLSCNIKLPKIPNSNLVPKLVNIVDAVNWDAAEENSGLVRKIVKQAFDNLNEEFGYKAGLTYWIMKGVNDRNIKRVVKELNECTNKNQYTHLRKWLEDARPPEPEPDSIPATSIRYAIPLKLPYDYNEDQLPF